MRKISLRLNLLKLIFPPKVTQEFLNTESASHQVPRKNRQIQFLWSIFCIVQISVLFSLTCHFPSAMPTSCPVFRYYSSSIAILKIYALRVTEISPGVAIHKICCVSSEIFNLKVPQLPGEAISSDKSCFS